MDISADILGAIEGYSACWRPPAGGLAGWVVAIDPLGGGSSEPAARRGDDAALLTAAVLFHFIQQAGGVPRLTRADDAPRRPESLADLGPCDVCVAIACTSAADEPAHLVPMRIAPGSTSPTSRGLADTMARVLHVTADPAPPPIAASSASAFTAPDGTSAVVRCQLAWTRSNAGNGSGADATAPHRACAQGICAALLEFAATPDGSAISRRRTCDAHADGHPDTAAPLPVPRFVDRPEQAELVAAARRIWPDGPLPVEQAAWFCEMWCATVLSDRSFVHFRPQIAVENSTVVIRGATNVAGMRHTLESALRALGIASARSEMRLLPEEGRLGDARFGVCVAAMALTYAEPAESAGVRTQLLYGEPLHLLDRDAGFLLAHADDGYWGWVRESAVRTISADRFSALVKANRAVVVRDLDVGGRRIPRGAALPFAFADDTRVKLSLPDGAEIDVAAHDVRAFDHTAEAHERVQRALALLHTPYVFGGVSPLGLDCSGMAQTLADQTGVSMPRDAAQQFPSGKLVATRWHREGIRCGDWLYFVNACGRIYHVALAMTPTHFIHSGPPEVRIDSLDPADRLYSAARAANFLAARRW